MKKLFILTRLTRAIITTTVVFIFSFSSLQAQQLWGMTSLGGDSGGGVIFNYDMQTSTSNDVHTFTGPNANPQGSLIQGSDGNFYGITNLGGAWGLGAIFKYVPTGEVTILHSFAGGSFDGAYPNSLSPYGNIGSSLIQGSDGNLYGMTWGGGASGLGTIFKCTTTGTETILHSFAGGSSDGATPYGSLVQGSDGNFYGMTTNGGASGVGTIVKCTTTGTETLLYSFAGGSSDGANPYGSLIQGSDGNFYGMTTNGGASDVGTIFKCTTTGTETMLYAFYGGCCDGEHPQGNLIQGSDGNLYGMATGDMMGGGTLYMGAIFKCTTTGTETIIAGTGNGLFYLHGSLIQGRDGNLYGMTQEGGVAGGGAIFQCTTSGAVTMVHNFTVSTSDGNNPYGSLIQGSDSNLYGMTPYGGVWNIGTIFKCSTTGVETVLHSFAGDVLGAKPHGSLIVGRDSNFYGMTGAGGVWDYGTIFKCTRAGAKTVLYSFAGGDSDGSNPNGSLILGPDSNFYGMTMNGGPLYGGGCLGYSYGDAGIIFKCTPSGEETVLHIFDGVTDGGYPYGNLLLGRDGNFYGMTFNGGTTLNDIENNNTMGSGIIFKCTPSGNETVLHNFNGDRLGTGFPTGSLIQGNDGDFYGLTRWGGSSNHGTIFQCTPTGAFKILYSFTGGTADGEYPYGSLVLANDSNFYGMTNSGGSSGYGTIFKCTPSGVETVLYSFAGVSDGKYPNGSLIQGSDGDFYGTTEQGGTLDYGTIFKCTPSGSVTILTNFTGANGSNPYGDLLEVKGPPVTMPNYPNSLVVYPNPSNGNFNFAPSQAELGSASQTIEVYNMLGEKVYSASLPQTPKGALNEINLSNNPNGVYLYRVLNDNGGLLGEGKLVIQK